MIKEGEGIICATGSSQDLTGKVSKTCKYVRWGLGGDGSERGNHDSIMSHRWGYVQRDEWRNSYRFVFKVRNIVYDKASLTSTLRNATHKKRNSGVRTSEFLNKVISELLTVDVKIDEEDNA